MRKFFNSSIFSIFVTVHLVGAYLHDFQFDRAFFPFNSWRIYHSESSRKTPIVTVHILRMGGLEFKDGGKEISTFPIEVFPQIRDRYELTNLLVRSYFSWAHENASESEAFARQVDSLLRHDYNDIQWEAKFYRVQPVQFYLNPKIIEADKPVLTLSSKSLYEN